MLYESSALRSGQLLGEFIIEEPIISAKEVVEEEKKKEVKVNGIQTKKEEVKKDSITLIDIVNPLGLSVTRDNQALIYKAVQLSDVQTGEEIPMLGAFSVVWKSPPPDMGSAIVTANIRRLNESKWTKLSYSLKESSQRIYIKPPVDDKKKFLEDQKAKQLSFKKAEEKYSSFDQIRHHELFWEYVRDKQWASLEGFLDHKSVVYYDNDRRIRPWRIVDLFRSLFGSTSGLVLACPFTFKPGLTRSRAVAELDIAGGVVKAVTRNQQPGGGESSPALPKLRNDARDGVVKSIKKEEEKEVEGYQDASDINSDSSRDTSTKSKVLNENNDQKDENREGIPRLVLNHANDEIQRPRTASKHDTFEENVALQPPSQQEQLDKLQHKDLEIEAHVQPIDSQENHQKDKELDESKECITERCRSKPLQLPQILFTEAVEGLAFIKTVKSLANTQQSLITCMRSNRLLESEEKRDFLMNPLRAR
jgi:hypothetical protein